MAIARLVVGGILVGSGSLTAYITVFGCQNRHGVGASITGDPTDATGESAGPDKRTVGTGEDGT